MNFLRRHLRKYNLLKVDEEEVETSKDALLSEIITCSTERGRWFSNAFKSSSDEARKSTPVSSLSDDKERFISETITLKEHATLTPKGVSPRTFTTKATADELKRLFVNMFIILECRPVCKECGNDFVDLNETLFVLESDKVCKVLCVSMEGQHEFLGCRICKTAFLNDENMRIHLLEHLEAKEVICEKCESTESHKVITHLSCGRNMEKAKLAQILITCKFCNHIIVDKPVLFQETITIYYTNEYKDTESHQCTECNKEMNPTSDTGKDKNENFTFQNLLCDTCIKKTINACRSTEEMNQNLLQSYSSLSSLDSVLTEETIPSLPGRCLYLNNKNALLRVEPMDFVIVDEVTEIGKTWYTCRFCGKTSNNHQEIIFHSSDHIAVKDTICKQCLANLYQY